MRSFEIYIPIYYINFIIIIVGLLNLYLTIIPAKSIRIRNHLIIQMYGIDQWCESKKHIQDEPSNYLIHLID